MKLPIYLDHHSTTPVAPEVLQAMMPYFVQSFGNPASKSHEAGWVANAAVENAREQIADLVGAGPKEIVFTSGGTESNNLAILGAVRAVGTTQAHIITTETEHRSVLDPIAQLEREGASVTRLSVDSTGRVTAQQVRDAIQPNTKLVSVIYANNEVGSINPIAEIGKICRENGVLLHVDAVQAVGQIPVHVGNDLIDLMSFTAHKFYGPKGIGGLYIRKKKPAIQLEPLIFGGGHERGLRSGTLNVPGVVGMAFALQMATNLMSTEMPRLAQLRDEFQRSIKNTIDQVSFNGNLEHRLPNNLSVTFHGVGSEPLMLELRDIAVSSGSACSSAVAEPSHVLSAMGLSHDDARSTVRFGLGRSTTREELEHTVIRLAEVVNRLRQLVGSDYGRNSNLG